MLYYETFDVAPLMNFNQIATSVALLPTELARRVMRSADPEERARRAGAYMLLERMIRRHTEDFRTTVEELVKPEYGAFFDSRNALEAVRYDSYGKPYMEGREHVTFSLSHSHKMAACVLNIAPVGQTAAPVGIDLQREVSDTECAVRVSSRYFSEGEKHMLAECAEDPAAYRWLFTRIWTRKEAILKYLGVGLSRIEAADSAHPEEHGGAFMESAVTSEILLPNGHATEERYAVTVYAAQEDVRAALAEQQ